MSWREVAVVRGARREVEALFLCEDFLVCVILHMHYRASPTLCLVDCETMEAWMTGTDNVLAFLGDHFEPRVRKSAVACMRHLSHRRMEVWCG